MLVTPKAYARNTVEVTNSGVSPLDDWAFTNPEVDQADVAWITSFGGDLVFSIDDTDPTATDGHVLLEEQTFALFGRENIRQFRAIGKSGAVDVTITLLRG